MFTLILAALCAWPQVAVAQIDAAFGLAYVVLSGAALHRLVNFPSVAVVGTELRGRRRAASGEEIFHGTIVGIDRDSITLTDANATIRFARSDIVAMELFRGRERKWAQGWGIGFVSAGAFGAAAGLILADDDSCGDFCFTRGQAAAILGIAGAIAGSTLGALFGAAVSGERWSGVDRIEPDARFTVMPLGRRAVGLGVELRW
jgi:hypothetical protein